MGQVRNVTITLRDKQTTGGLIPSDAVFGEPFINIFDGVLKFSGVTGGSFEPMTQSGVFEVGSKLYNQKITNRFNVNDNFIISGGTGIISTYNGSSGSGLSGKFLSGTTAGFVLANVSDIASASAGSSGDVQYNNGSNGFGAESVFNYNASTDTLIVPNFSAVTFSASSKIYSAGTSLETIIYNIAASTENTTSIQAGANITTGGTQNSPIISVVDSPSFNNITYSGTSTGGNSIATNVSATTAFYSAGTNLDTIIRNLVSAGDTNDITRVQPGTNITTGGTGNNPTVNLVASPSIFNLAFSGTATGGAVNATSLSATSLTNTRVLFAGANGMITDDAGLTYNSTSDTLSAGNIVVGVPGQTGVTATIYGSVLVVGEAISGFTSQLYIEDNLIELNYNPTASTTSTSLGSGWSIQDGSGVAGTPVLWDVRGTSVGLDNRSFATNLQDIRIRETGTISSPNGVRVIAEFDELNGGSY